MIVFQVPVLKTKRTGAAHENCADSDPFFHDRYNKRFDALSQKFKEAEAKKDAVAQQISGIRDRRGTMEDFLRILKQQDGEVTTFSEKLWYGLLDYAMAYADGRLMFTFKNGSTFES